MGGGPRKSWYPIFALLAGCLLLAIARANYMTFPLPSKDSARFYLAAHWWAQYGSLSPAVLNAPGGIFWMPDGFTFFLGIPLRLFGNTMAVATTVCEFTVAAGVGVFALVFRILAGSWKIGALATLLLLTPPVVFAANQVRMEAPLFLLIALVLLLHLNGYYLAAGSLLFAGVLIHPAPGLAAVCYATTVLILRKQLPGARWGRTVGWAVLLVVVACFCWQALRTLHHLDLFRQHMAFQAARKASRSLRDVLFKPQGAIFFAALATTALLLLRRRARLGGLKGLEDILPAAALALGLLTYAVLGGEMAYDVYSLSAVPAILFCLVAREFCAARADGLPDSAARGGLVEVSSDDSERALSAARAG